MAAVIAALLMTATAALGVPVPAYADAPPSPVTEPFHAPMCEGTTPDDPTDADGPVSDLTEVFGQRLTDYSAGRVVVLYDTFGSNDGEYPPLCGTRYVDGVGPVSEWMFCTDVEYHACGRTDENGNLVAEGQVLPPMEGIGANPRLNRDQEKVIAYLLQNGHPFDAVGHSEWSGVDRASTADSGSRDALQYLIWCVSDADWMSGTSFQDVCDANIDAAEQARILSLIPDDPQLMISFDEDAVETLTVGSTAEVTLTTNVYNQPIDFQVDGGVASVCSGDAVLEDVNLVVAGSDPAVSTDVGICVTAATAGAVALQASATPPSTRHITWNQSAGTDTVDCQVYATFETTREARVVGTTTVPFAAEPTEPTDPTEPADPTDPDEPTDPADPTNPDEPDEPIEPIEPADEESAPAPVAEAAGLAATGTGLPLPAIALGALAMILGATLIARRPRRR